MLVNENNNSINFTGEMTTFVPRDSNAPFEGVKYQSSKVRPKTAKTATKMFERVLAQSSSQGRTMIGNSSVENVQYILS